MAHRVYDSVRDITYALVAANNERQVQSVTTEYHADRTQISSGHYTTPVVTLDTINSPDATGTESAVALANDARTVLSRHFADSRAHDTAVSPQIATAVATNEASAMALTNAMVAFWEQHLIAASVHYNNDSANGIDALIATDTATLCARLNELKAKANKHFDSAPPGSMLQIVATP